MTEIWFPLVSSTLSQWRQTAWTCITVEYIGAFPGLRLNVCVTWGLTDVELACCPPEQFRGIDVEMTEFPAEFSCLLAVIKPSFSYCD